ncbi:MAG: phosphoribosylformylglycinamidine cyclo-ligase [Candidatus Omnitrophica bacterium]|nr:phosphoribosylformylglycinamidine cyclo-ligase [Candidatus Omnitrophota bacterium]
MPVLLERETAVKKLTYKQSGVDIAAATAFKGKIKGLVKKSQSREVLKGIGGFGCMFDFPQGYRNPILVSSSDGVGTKLKIAVLAGKHDTVGIDAVAMNVNDILCIGAQTLFFLDYIAYSKLKEGILLDVIKGLNDGCLQAGCALIGGETAQMPGMYREGDYDLAGFCVGVVEKDKIIDGSAIRPGDVVVGLESNGIHSNGYSLVRRVLSVTEQKRMSRELLRPTRIYVKPVLELLKKFSRSIHGISHITGGAFYDKIARILPDTAGVRIEKGSWPVPPIFKLIQNKGGIEFKEMHHTFNMGIGMVLLVEPASAQVILKELADLKLKSWIIGKVTTGNKLVEII